MKPLVTEWIKRLFGYGSIAAGGVVYAKVKDPEIAAWVGSTIALVGGIILNKALPWVFPTAAKLASTPPPQPQKTPMFPPRL